MIKKISSVLSSLLLVIILSSGMCGDEKQRGNISSANEIYTCLPCGNGCDTLVHKEPGVCEHCHMELVKKSTITHAVVLPENLCSYITKTGIENIILLDVRTPEEFNGTAPDKFGRLKNAINIPVQDLKERIKELDGYKGKQIIVYCSHSHRSPQASYMLTQNGFKQVTNMSGGMSVWKEKVKETCSDIIFVKQ